MRVTFCTTFILYRRFKPVIVIISIMNLLLYSWKRYLEHRLKSMDLLQHHRILHHISRKVRLRHISYFARKLDALNKHNFYAFLERCTSSSNFYFGPCDCLMTFANFTNPHFLPLSNSNASVWRWPHAVVVGSFFHCSFLSIGQSTHVQPKWLTEPKPCHYLTRAAHWMPY